MNRVNWGTGRGWSGRETVNPGGARRRGFTLVELMVAMALIIFIMVVLTEAFAAALNSFRVLKALGDMGERLRAAATVIRRDLAADHFDGRKRVSELQNGAVNEPREGFFTYTAGALISEGNDDRGNPSVRNTAAELHFSVKFRGNERQQFASAMLPDGQLLSQPTTFFDQPIDARFMNPAQSEYRSAWAEVHYFLAQAVDQNGQRATAPQGGAATSTQLYALYRSQFVVIPDNRLTNTWNGSPTTSGLIDNSQLPRYYEFSCFPGPGGTLYFNNPTDIMYPHKRAFNTRGGFNPQDPKRWAATMLLTDVVSFDVEILRQVNNVWTWTRDGWVSPNPNQSDVLSNTWALRAMKVTLRVWDVKTNQSRQITLIQDM